MLNPFPVARCFAVARLIVPLVALLACFTARGQEAKKSFDVPAGNAGQTLKQFATQAGVQIVFSSEVVGSVKTKAVQGELSARDALERMLHETGLVATEEKKSGAFAVRQKNSADLEKNVSGPTVRRRAETKNEADNAGEAIALSPFTVTTNSDSGWLANTTLVSNRTNTALRDTPVAIDALTDEFMRDIGAYNEFEAAAWVSNVQLADETGRTDLGRYSFRGIQNQWTSNRNFFRWYVPNDNYNIERIDFGKGSNSLLFGDNEPGGLATVYTKRARIGRSFTNALVQGGSFDSWRWQLDHNQSFNSKFAVRLNATRSHEGRNFDYNEFNFYGYHITGTFRPFKNTEIRAEAEAGGHERIWGDNNNSIRINPAAGLGLNNRLTILPDGRLLDNTILTNGTSINGVSYLMSRDRSDAPGVAVTLTDRDVRQIGAFTFKGFPEHTNWAGPANPNDRHYTTFSVFIEQRITDKLILELAYNQQKQWWDNSVLQDPFTEKVDFTGRRYIDVGWVGQRQQNLVQVPRITLAYTFDRFQWTQQTLVMTAETRMDAFMAHTRQHRWYNAPGATATTNVSGAAFRPFFRYYLDEPGAYPPRKDTLLSQLPAGTKEFATVLTGQQHGARAYSASLSGRYFGGRLQSLLGTRYDLNDTATLAPYLNQAAHQVQGQRFWPGSKSENPTAWTYDPTFHLRRWTYNAGLVFRLNRGTNVYVMDSSSFRFAGMTNFVNDALGPIIGRTREAGLKTAFLDDRLQWNLSYYDLMRRNVRIAFDRGGLTDAQLEAAINAGIPATSPDYKTVVANSSGDIGDNFSRGWETSFLFFPASGFRARFGGAYGKVTQQNAFKIVHALLAAAEARNVTDPAVRGYMATLKSSLSASGGDGKQVAGLGATRASLNYALDYRFANDSRLHGFSVGVNGSYNGGFVLGYLDTGTDEQAVNGGRTFTLHATTGYQRRIFDRPVTFRLNVFNLIAPDYREIGLVQLPGNTYSKRIFYGPPLSFRLTASTNF